MEDKLIHRFFNLIALGQVHHAYLVIGTQPLAIDKFVSEVIAAMGCSRFSDQHQPCHECQHCLKVKHQSLADVVTVQPDGKFIRVDQIRSLREWLNRSPLELGYKVAYIKEANAMNDAAANALLKVLEEPPTNTYIFLATTSKDQLLPTIVSRVQTVYLDGDQDRLALFGDLPAQQAGILNRLSTKNQSYLMETTTDMVAWLGAIHKFFDSVRSQDPRAFVQIQSLLKPYLSTQGTDAMIDYWMCYNHQQLLEKYQLDRDQGRDKQLVEETIRSASQLQDGLIQARQYLQANVSPQLTLERFVIEQAKLRREAIHGPGRIS